IPLKQVIESNTGNTENKYKIKINNFEINLFKTLSKFEKYDTIETYNQIQIFSNFYLPIELIKITNTEKVENEITYGIEEAKAIGIEKVSKKIEEQLGDSPNILQKYENVYAGEGYVEVEVIYEVLENIGTKEKIVF
ncbi:MAG: sporulation protein YqfD, partial [Clostridia bacterium]